MLFRLVLYIHRSSLHACLACLTRPWDSKGDCKCITPYAWPSLHVPAGLGVCKLHQVQDWQKPVLRWK